MIVGFTAALLIGLSLGIIGGGGSILTVPVLVYLFHVNAIEATVYSLFIVGVTSSIGAFSAAKKQRVDFQKVIYFGLPSVVGVYLARYFLLPLLPAEIPLLFNVSIRKEKLMMFSFALLMLFAAYHMLRPQKAESTAQKTNVSQLLFQGLGIGMITGFIGAGGGFLIIPVLVGMLKLPMKKAIGTSLVIISINSLFGFLAGMGQVETLNWIFLLQFSGLAIIGILIGGRLSNNVDGARLKPAFGWFILCVGIAIVGLEIWR